MSNTLTAPRRAASAKETPRRGETPGRLKVGDHVGALAAHAAQAVRRSGLRPGLERSFGGAADLIGRIVAQEPAPGEELARNGMVTLYVAVPTPAESEATTDVHAGRAMPLEPTPASPPAASDHGVQGSPRARRTRKRRPEATFSVESFDVAPEPAPPASEAREYDEPMHCSDAGQLQSGMRSGGSSASADVGLETVDLGRGHGREAAEPNWLDEDVVEHAHDILAGRRHYRGPWHTRSSRTAPMRAVRGLLSWSSRHRVLATTTTAFTVWVTALALAAFSAHPVHPPRRARASMTSPALGTVPARPAAAAAPRARPMPSPDQRIRRRSAAQRRVLSRPQGVKTTPVVQAPVGHNAQADLPSTAASAPPEGAATTGQSEQTGGPFSP